MEGTEVIGVVITDLSERRRKEQAQEAVRLRDEFLSIASHELRTPLSTLILHLGLLERLTGQSDPSRLEQNVRKAKGQADRMTELINRLLDVTRIASGRLELELEPHDLGEIVRGVVEQVSEEATKARCEFRLQIDRGHPHPMRSLPAGAGDRQCHFECAQICPRPSDHNHPRTAWRRGRFDG